MEIARLVGKGHFLIRDEGKGRQLQRQHHHNPIKSILAHSHRVFPTIYLFNQVTAFPVIQRNTDLNMSAPQTISCHKPSIAV